MFFMGEGIGTRRQGNGMCGIMENSMKATSEGKPGVFKEVHSGSYEVQAGAGKRSRGRARPYGAGEKTIRGQKTKLINALTDKRT